MLGKNITKKLFAVIATVSVWSVTSMVALAAAPKDITGELLASGQVTVNGNPAVSDTTIVSGSTISTAANSSATISLGKVGRLELQADSSVMLKFSESYITAVLSSGKATVSNASGVSTTLTTKDATIIADSGQANTFTVEVECSHTHLNTTVGFVTMRTGTNDKQVAAGGDASAGNLSQTGCKPCLRPAGATAPFPVAGIGVGALVGLILAGAGALGAAVVLGGRGNSDVTLGGGVIVVSPTR